MSSNDIITIYTDGSCLSNPGGKGGYAAIIIKDAIPRFVAGYDDNTTNQSMELKAVIAGLKIISVPSNIVVYSDSAYVVNCFRYKWYEKWEVNGWKNSKKEDVANIGLWTLLLQLVRYHNNVEFRKVKGHSGNIFNEKCDQLAKDIILFKTNIDESDK